MNISEIPIIGKLPPQSRLFVMIFLVIIVAGLIIYNLTKSSTYEKLKEYNWCVDSIIYDGKVCKLLSYQAVKLTGYGFCDEEIDFRGIGKISLPGFSSRKPLCNWQLKNDSLQIMNTDTFDFVYNGMYQVEFSGGLILKSKKTTIYCHAEVHDYYYLFRH